MVPAVVVLAGALAVVVGYLVVVLVQVRRISAQLRRRRDEGTHHAVRLELVNRQLTELTSLVNDTIADAERSAARTARQEQRSRELMTELSHDLRTPLTVVRGYQQMLADSRLDAHQREILRVASQNADALADQIDNLFAYAQLHDTSVPLRSEPIDVTVVVGEALLAAVDPLEERGLDIVADMDGPVTINSDPDLVQRIVGNLIRNATQYAVDVLSVSVTPDAEVVSITMSNRVADPGAVDVDRVFDRHYSQRAAGTGLGLFIVRTLATRLGGGATALLDADTFAITVTLASDLPGSAGTSAR